MLQLEPMRDTFKAHTNQIVSSKNWSLAFTHMAGETKDTGQVKFLVGLTFSWETHDMISISLWLCGGPLVPWLGTMSATKAWKGQVGGDAEDKVNAPCKQEFINCYLDRAVL